MLKKIRFYIFLVGIASVYLLIFWLVEIKSYGLRINQSQSLPQKLFLSKTPDHLYRGMYVSIVHPNSPNIIIAKQVVGLPGDSISVKNSQVYINDIYFGDIKHLSSSGKLYNPISYKIIPPDYMFLSSTHVDSFDSRYEEFGLIPQNAIKEELWPIF